MDGRKLSPHNTLFFASEVCIFVCINRVVDTGFRGVAGLQRDKISLLQLNKTTLYELIVG
jgi:predicted aspartyl protease